LSDAAGPTLTAQEARGLTDFHEVLAAHDRAIVTATLGTVREDPKLGRVLAELSEADLEAGSGRGRELLLQGAAGDWGPYVERLHLVATQVAGMGVDYPAWSGVARTWLAAVTTHLVRHLAAHPVRLENALAAMHAFITWTLGEIATAYFEASAPSLLESDPTHGEVERLERAREMAERQGIENRRIAKASSLKSEFLAHLSHELRTPLNAIIGFAELLHDGAVTSGSPEYSVFVADILTSAQHLLQLSNDVLDLSKVEAGQLEFRTQATNLPQLAGEVTQILRTLAADKQIRVQVESRKPYTVIADGSRLKQVLYNYVSNALKFTPAGGRVWIRTGPGARGMFRLEVQDTGVGIAPQDIQRLFNEFQQLGENGGAAGSGLGLALSRKLVEAQGGVVGVRSEPGVGSTFFAELPRRANPLAIARVDPNTRKPVARKPVARKPVARKPVARKAHATRVLVGEGDTNDGARIAQVLRGAGYRVDRTANGQETVSKCAARDYDVITLDLLLPVLSGFDVLREIRRAGPNTSSPVVVVTAAGEPAMVAGLAVADFLRKPFKDADLVAAVARAHLAQEVA
jgi:signal transduction histidine kinase/CheY-like chemotaxis protein